MLMEAHCCTRRPRMGTRRRYGCCSIKEQRSMRRIVMAGRRCRWRLSGATRRWCGCCSSTAQRSTRRIYIYQNVVASPEHLECQLYRNSIMPLPPKHVILITNRGSRLSTTANPQFPALIPRKKYPCDNHQSVPSYELHPLTRPLGSRHTVQMV